MTDDRVHAGEAGIAQKQTDGALRESEELLSLFLRHSPIFAYIKEVTSSRSVVLHASDNYDQMIGISGRDMVGKSMTDLFPAELAAKITADDWDVVSKGEMLRLDEDLNGRSYTSIKFPIVQGGRTLLAGYTIDVTERKQAEEALRDSERSQSQLSERLNEAQHLALIGSWEWDLQTDDVWWSEETYRLFGVTPQDFVPSFDENGKFIHPDDFALYSASFQHSLQTGEPLDVELRLITRDGSLKHCQAKGRVVYGDAGQPSRFVGTIMDITDRKRAEEEKNRLQAQLFQTQKVAAIGQLAGGVAHDFNNLLTGILGNIALMRTRLPPADPLLENLDAAETAARRAADLTKGLLTFSRSAVVMSLPMNVRTGLDASLALLKQSLPATIEIVHDYGKSLWNILLDQSQMTQILLNLAVNARDAMQGRGTLTIRARNEVVGEEYARDHLFARTGEFVHLSVADTGTGLSTDDMQHLFEPFYTTKPVGSGTGLGLSIVYGAVKHAGGWITAESSSGAGEAVSPGERPRSGATFDIYIPRCLEEPIEPAAPGPLPVEACAGTIIVVEDEPIVCAVARTLLSRSGYTVLTAPDGASAVNVLREHPTGVGLILLDMTMPGMTTNEVIRAIRTLDPTVPILLNSGYTSNDSVKHMLDDGSVQGFLGKPYDLHELLGRVQELLRRT
jgi:two-component system cell cycle sensor histidine kinase/response regulator CckA